LAIPRKDGTASGAVNRKKLTDLFVKTRKGGDQKELIWDERQPGLALSVRPSGKTIWKVIYRFSGKPRWLTQGDAKSIGLADARRLTARVMLDVAGTRPRQRTQGRARFGDHPPTGACRPQETPWTSRNTSRRRAKLRDALFAA